MRKTIIILLTLHCSFVIPLFAAEKNEGLPIIEAVRSDGKITIDGILNETVWQREGYSDLIQRDPIEGAKPTEKTLVWIAYNNDGLFVAGTCFHSGPDTIAGGLARRDKFVESDWFWFWIDPNHDRQNGFGFAVNPDGSIIDHKMYKDIFEEESWDGVWEVAAKKQKDRWTFEMFIPFSQLRFDKKKEYTWGVNFKRYVLSNAEHDYFSMIPKSETGFVSRFGTLTGLKDISPPARLFLLPYTMGKINNFPERKDSPFYPDRRYGKDIGLDVKYGLTGNLTLDLAVNPDFGQAEVDPAVINLSAFETYYKEKRAFFLEGADIFYFGSNPIGGLWGCYWNEPSIFYSRRIGRPSKGMPTHEGYIDTPEQTTILGAVKVSGKVGSWSLGSINAVTQREFATVDSSGVRFREEIEPPTYYGVYRGMNEFNQGNQGLGFILTGVARDQDLASLRTINNSRSVVAGMDGWTFIGKSRSWAFMGKIAYSTLHGSRERITQLQKSSAHYYQRPDYQFVSLDTNRTSLNGTMGRFGLKKVTGNVMFQTALGIISPGFNSNDLGFSSYGNLVNMHVVAGYRWLKPTSWYRELYLNAMTSRNFDFDKNRLFSQYYWAGNILLLNYLSIYSNFQLTPHGLNLYQTRGGPIMAYPGFSFSMIGFNTDSRKNIQLGSSMGYRDTKDGSYALNTDISGTFKLASSLKLILSVGYYRVLDYAQWVFNAADPSAPYGYHFVFADLNLKEVDSEFRMDWGITPRLSIQCYVRPYISVGEYSRFKELAKARTYDFLPYDFNRFNPDFNFKSFKANLVFRWEYLPGSLLYLVWTQDRTNYNNPGIFNLREDIRSLFNNYSDNIFFLKLSYMVSIY